MENEEKVKEIYNQLDDKNKDVLMLVAKGMEIAQNEKDVK